MEDSMEESGWEKLKEGIGRINRKMRILGTRVDSREGKEGRKDLDSPYFRLTESRIEHVKKEKLVDG